MVQGGLWFRYIFIRQLVNKEKLLNGPFAERAGCGELLGGWLVGHREDIGTLSKVGGS